MRCPLLSVIFARSKTARLVAVLVVAVALFGAGYLVGRGGAGAAAKQAATAPTTSGPLGEQARREPGDPFAIGEVDAPVVMVVFSDYRCPYCGRFSRVTEPELVRRYVDTGRLRIEWRDFPLFGDASVLAARAGRAAAAQGKFWEFNRAVYEAAPEAAHHDLTAGKLRDFAVQAGVPDLERFAQELAGEEHDAAIAADLYQGRSLGMTGTPSFVIDGNPIVGAQPTEVFVGVIERALAAAGQR